MAGNFCDKCKLQFPQSELSFDGWYLLCTECLKEVSPSVYNKIKSEKQDTPA